MRSYWVYILASKPRGTIYIGITNGIIGRVEQHRAGKASSFTRKYEVHRLVWFHEFGNAREAIQREKTLKEWPRAWKANLIERENPHWDDLYPSLSGVKVQLIVGADRWLDRGDKPRDDTRAYWPRNLHCHPGTCCRDPALHMYRPQAITPPPLLANSVPASRS